MDSSNPNDQERKPLIMVVDDNPHFLSGMETTLQMEGFDVWTSLNGQEALDELFKVFQTQIDDDSKVALARLPDLMLVDIMMPIMDGYELYEQTSKNPYLNHIPFVFLTAKGQAAEIRYGKELGSDDYLPKLTSTEDILATIRGKLKRVEQRRSIMTQFAWDPNNAVQGRSIIFIAVVVLFLAVSFCGGYFAATFFTG
jgi:DNA-binding response OmpR family regulator